MAIGNALKRVKEMTENQSAGVSWLKFLSFLIILAVVVYSEYMFLSIIGVALPQGNNRFLAIVGAVATGMSVIVLLGAKIWWVTPGSQFIWSWVFMGLEITVMTMNDILGYALHMGPVDQTLVWWQSFTPASPLIALLGWILMLFFDATQREKHKDMELVAKKQKQEREYIEAAHTSEMELRTNHLSMVTEQLRDAIQSAEAQQRIKNHAARMVDRVLTDVSGIVAGDYTPIAHSPTQSSTPQISAPQQASLAQEATIEPIEDVQPNPIQRLLNVFKPQEQEDDYDRDIRMMNERQEAIDAKIACAGNCGKVGAKANWCYFPENWDILYCPLCYQIAKAERAKK